MRTCSAQTPIDRPAGPRAKAFTLVELLVVMSILSLLVFMVQANLFGMLRRSSFKTRVQDFISTMQMAASHAVETGHRYEMIIDLSEQTYLLRELTGADLTAQPLLEQTVTEGSFGGNCRISHVEFDDGTYTNQDRAKFRAGRNGWQYGGKVVFLDESEQSYAVIVNRVTPMIQLIEGDPPLMKPKTKEEVPFL